MDKNIKFQQFALTQIERAKIKHQTPVCLWMTGLSGAGKSTLANALEQELNKKGKHTYILDGDNLRHGLNSDLGFSKADRNENVRRAAEAAKLIVDAGLIVIAGLISPFKQERDWARSLFKDNQFKEIYISTSLQECEQRDVKGLYQKARRGEVKEFTGIDSPYEPPENPDVIIDTQNKSISECVQLILEKVNLT
ncbi:adenylylsulfate kinase [Methylophilales bacterium MBRSG12]|uniref:Adenylyl-sulfate kinase n=1 Tax=Methylophilales bacterium MBRS-H7 TaxID=1623450 RepID=A0A0H4J0H9_9PROT|nr:adenylylsulfate kinase [Methylophilales bacterium MBRSF5]AKO66284.1 adenylylsulfate kinase [Methylophilales bacterium MBRS-H7]AKO67601.1 adenylylsulfate kinase [Methylophilales bacterium MBRSG12]